MFGAVAEDEGGAGGELLAWGVAGGESEAAGLGVCGLEGEEEDRCEHTTIYRIV